MSEHQIWLRRAYDPPKQGEGYSVLVDRVWPRGVSKEELGHDAWNRDVAPSTELRKWFGHDPAKWDEFRERYTKELDKAPDAWKPIAEAAREGRVTLIYGAKDEEHNQAVVLKDYLLDRLAD
jgi:uncharacterized protein YeaO (DUF488 family)